MLDMEGHIKLIDLGLSKQLMSSDTNTYSMCGTTEYMAPEIISRKGHSFAVDFWSMAILMYEMLIGKLPFEGKDRKHIQRKVLT
jgi:serine/threonine protein kinase